MKRGTKSTREYIKARIPQLMDDMNNALKQEVITATQKNEADLLFAQTAFMIDDIDHQLYKEKFSVLVLCGSEPFEKE